MFRGKNTHTNANRWITLEPSHAFIRTLIRVSSHHQHISHSRACAHMWCTYARRRDLEKNPFFQRFYCINTYFFMKLNVALAGNVCSLVVLMVVVRGKVASRAIGGFVVVLHIAVAVRGGALYLKGELYPTRRYAVFCRGVNYWWWFVSMSVADTVKHTDTGIVIAWHISTRSRISSFVFFFVFLGVRRCATPSTNRNAISIKCGFYSQLEWYRYMFKGFI